MGFHFDQPSWAVGSIEAIIILAIFTLIVCRPSRGRRRSNVSNFVRSLARNKSLAVFTCGALVIVLRSLLIPVLGMPQPIWHDEFSFLVAGDTFAHGRLTNPTHPMWAHFETFHVLQKPTYQSICPPGEGVVLALGERLGNPWLGQLLTAALMCSGVCWMLQGWLPPGWALLGGILAVLRLGVLCYWLDSYFCASLPALGGALVLGALPRIQERAGYGDAIWMGLGLITLANTRPYEGFVFAVPVAVLMLVWLIRQKKFPKGVVLRQVVLPLVLVLCAGGSATSYYFWRVTGNPFRMPYQVNRDTYSIPYFYWQTPRVVAAYPFPEIRHFYEGFVFSEYHLNRSLSGFSARLWSKLEHLWIFYVGPLLTVPFIALPWVARDRRMRFPLLVVLCLSVGAMFEVWTAPHYLAPATCLFYLLLIQAMRHLRFWKWRGKPIGESLLHAIPMIAVAMIVIRVSAIALGTPLEQTWPKGNLVRESVIKKLNAAPGKQVVIVHYASDHWYHLEYVYNWADIDGSKIVWARDMGPAGNEELIRYFHDRQVWLLTPDDEPPKLRAYAATAAPANASLRNGN